MAKWGGWIYRKKEKPYKAYEVVECYDRQRREIARQIADQAHVLQWKDGNNMRPKLTFPARCDHKRHNSRYRESKQNLHE